MKCKTAYPGGSKSRVDRAGDNIRNNIYNNDDIIVVEEWRAAHRNVLNTFQSILRTRTKDEKILVAQRHKRKNTIFNKLIRFPKMQLSRMDDVAGCRLIFDSIDELYRFRDSFHLARFKHVRKNYIDKYDYIKNPKDTGYRGVHDVYIYDVNSNTGRHLKGLYIEIQYRTFIQHAWATAVEVLGFVTESQPKFKEGDVKYVTAMSYASEMLARAYENKCGPFPSMSSAELCKRFASLDTELSLLKTLSGLRLGKRDISQNKNIILMFSSDGQLETKSFRDSTEALKSLFELERQYPKSDIVLVRADTSDDIRIAFRNYFSDTTDFIALITDAEKKLMPPNLLKDNP